MIKHPGDLCYLLGQATSCSHNQDLRSLIDQITLTLSVQPGAPLSSHNQDQMWLTAQNGLYTICMTETTLRFFPRPLSWYSYHTSRIHHFGRNDIYPELSFDVGMFPWALGIVLHKETFPTNYVVFKYIGNKSAGISPKFDPG